MTPLLHVDRLSAGYGSVDVLQAIELSLDPGEIVAVFGSNGAGKSTLLRTISGLLSPTDGSIRLDGRSIVGRQAYEIARLGVAHVPEGRGVLGQLTVSENLRLGSYMRKSEDRPVFQDTLDLFPILRERADKQAAMLSGGEQQMLAIARGLLGGPKLLMIDELSLGLAPRIIHEIMVVLSERARQGLGILLVEQNVHMTLGIATKVYILASGKIVFQGNSKQLAADQNLIRTYLGLD